MATISGSGNLFDVVMGVAIILLYIDYILYIIYYNIIFLINIIYLLYVTAEQKSDMFA